MFEPLRFGDKELAVLAAAAEEVHPQVHPLVSLQATRCRRWQVGNCGTYDLERFLEPTVSSQWAMWEKFKVGLP